MCRLEASKDNEVLMQSINGVEKKALPNVLCMTNLIHHKIDDLVGLYDGIDNLVRLYRG